MIHFRSRSRNFSIALLASFGVLLVACGSDPVAPAADADGISFDYSGVVNGTFHASGTPTRTSQAFLASTSYATAMSYVPGEGNHAGTISIMANDKAGRLYGNFLALSGIPANVTAGTIASTATGALSFGLTWNQNTFVADTQFVFTISEIAVTEYSTTRVRGKFAGSIRLFGPTSPIGTATITNGRFNIAVNDTAATDFRCRIFSC